METYEIKTALAKVDLGIYPLSKLRDLVDLFFIPIDSEAREEDITMAYQAINSIILSSNTAFEVAKQSKQFSSYYEYIIFSLDELNESIKQCLANSFKFDDNIVITNELLEEYSHHRELIDNTDWVYSLSKLEDTIEMQEFKEWVSVRNSPFYELFYKIDKYICWLDELYINELDVRELKHELDSYKPAKEHRLESYFTCDDYEALRGILRRDIRSKRGKAVAMVLVALDMAGCKMVGDFTPLFDNILTPLYGVCGSRQGVTDQLSRIKETTESRDPKKAKLLKEMSEKYRLQLQ